jgi:hypothetical protein
LFGGAISIDGGLLLGEGITLTSNKAGSGIRRYAHCCETVLPLSCCQIVVTAVGTGCYCTRQSCLHSKYQTTAAVSMCLLHPCRCCQQP